MLLVTDNKSKINKKLFPYWLPWFLFGLCLIFIVIREMPLIQYPDHLFLDWRVISWFATIVLVGLITLVFVRLKDMYGQREILTSRFEEAEKSEAEASHRLEAIIEISKKSIEANDEYDVFDLVLRLIIKITGIEHASFVPLDEHGQPQTVFSHGKQPVSSIKPWLEYLASKEVRDRCGACEHHESLENLISCPMLQAPFDGSSSLYCFPIRRGEIEYGVVTLSLSDPEIMTHRTSLFLRALLDEAALGIESIRLRKRELGVIREFQTLRQKSDLKTLLDNLLQNLNRTLEADFSVMQVQPQNLHEQKNDLNKIEIATGSFPSMTHPFFTSLMHSVMVSSEPVLLGDISGDPSSPEGLHSMIAAPLLLPECSTLGVILIGNQKAKNFNRRQLSLLQTMAGQVALLVQNAELMSELEYKTMIEERTRLAREIHDGLAQTLGFLKLQVAQIRNYLSKGDLEKVQRTTDLCYTTLNEAYQDARQAIDGLRMAPAEYGIQGLLEQIADDFKEVTNIPIELDCHDLKLELPVEIQIQLIRIVQEAMSNIRKHSQARKVWVECQETDQQIKLEVRDDGIGFFPEDISLPSRHGLRGMQERAKLICAELILISRPHEGTIVQLILPLGHIKEVVP